MGKAEATPFRKDKNNVMNQNKNKNDGSKTTITCDNEEDNNDNIDNLTSRMDSFWVCDAYVWL